VFRKLLLKIRGIIPRKIKDDLKSYRFPLLIDFLKWVLIDYLRGREIEFKEFTMVVGRRGSGKTLAMSYMLQEYRKKYGDGILIATNYGYKDQDFPYTTWELFLKDYDRPIIFAIDEIQNEFQSLDYKNFPKELFHEITQSRKGNKMIISTSQVFGFVDNKFREYTEKVHVVKNFLSLSRLFWITTYDQEEYTRMLQTKNYLRKAEIDIEARKFFVADDMLRNCYDTKAKISSIRTKQYQDYNDFVVNTAPTDPIIIDPKLLKSLK